MTIVLTNTAKEFPDFDLSTLPAIPRGFIDQSWHNDTCPSFRNEELKLTLHVDYAKPEDREHAETARFSLVRVDYEHDLTDADRAYLYEGNDWNGVLIALAEVRLARQLDELGGADNVGYADAYDAAMDIASQLGIKARMDILFSA